MDLSIPFCGRTQFAPTVRCVQTLAVRRGAVPYGIGSDAIRREWIYPFRFAGEHSSPLRCGVCKPWRYVEVPSPTVSGRTQSVGNGFIHSVLRANTVRPYGAVCADFIGRFVNRPHLYASLSASLLASARRSSASKNSTCRVPPLVPAVIFTCRPRLSRRASSTSS